MMKTILFTLAILFSALIQAAIYGGGSGTAEDPYQIWTPGQMNSIGSNTEDYDKHFKLMLDLDMSIYTGTQYHVIGNVTNKFTGTFDGSGHVIKNLTYTTNNTFYDIGLFGRTSNATIKNLGLENVVISSKGGWVGGLVGRSESSSIIACFVTGSVTGTSWVGGLVGYNQGSLTDCYSECSVNITDEYSVGGGLVGINYGTLTNCYSTGSAGASSTHFLLGGLVGMNYSSISFCFWDTQTSGQSVGVGSGSSEGVIGKTTTEMKMLSTFTFANWDFTNETHNGTHDYWRMCTDGLEYPRLNWESVDGDFACPNGINSEDLNFYIIYWLMNNCALDNNYCGGADLDYSGAVNLADWTIFAESWLCQ